MISILGNSTDGTKTPKDPRELLQLASLQTLISVGWLGLSWDRIGHMRAIGKYVGPWRYIVMGFWGVMLLFWIVNACYNFKRYRASKASEG